MGMSKPGIVNPFSKGLEKSPTLNAPMVSSGNGKETPVIELKSRMSGSEMFGKLKSGTEMNPLLMPSTKSNKPPNGLSKAPMPIASKIEPSADGFGTIACTSGMPPRSSMTGRLIPNAAEPSIPMPKLPSRLALTTSWPTTGVTSYPTPISPSTPMSITPLKPKLAPRLASTVKLSNRALFNTGGTRTTGTCGSSSTSRNKFK